MSGGCWRSRPNTMLHVQVGERIAVKLKDGAGFVRGRVAMVAPDRWLLVSEHGTFTVYTGAVLAIHPHDFVLRSP